MKKVKLIMYIGMFLNFIVALIKLVSGIMFNFSSLIADSLQSMFDFITDIIVMFASKVGDKRANKRHPFGYGTIENIANLFIGFILILLAIFILIRGFISGESEVNLTIFIILIVTLVVKLFTVLLLWFSGKRYKNNSLILSVKESFVDMLATVIVLVVSVLMLFKDNVNIFRYADKVGSLVISLMIIKVAYSMIKVNIDYLLGSNEENEEIGNKIKDIMDDYNVIKDNEFKLIRIGDYYTLYLTIELDDSITLRRIMNLEDKLKKKIKSFIKDIKYIQIEIKDFK